MARYVQLLAVVILTLAAGCSTALYTYREDMFEGRRLLEAGEFARAREAFARAAAGVPTPAAFAFAATASYKMNDLPAAEGYIRQALALTGGDYSLVRILGYEALILLGQQRTAEGMEALRAYLDVYSRSYPLTSIEEVRAMAGSGKVEIGRLEALIDEQITWYEKEVEQYLSTYTGFYDRPPTLRSW